MTPKEKANELVGRYRQEVLRGKYRIDGFVIEELAEECALIAVNEMLNAHLFDLDEKEYWKYVKQEIEAL